MNDPVPGWLVTWGFFLLGIVSLFLGLGQDAIIFAVGGTIISVMRSIENDRRERDAASR